MTIRFDQLPVGDESRLRTLLQPTPTTRRRFLGGVLKAGTGLALGAFAAINMATERAAAAYFDDYADTSSGPCTSYASNHTESGIKCGPSTVCGDGSCCWRYRSGAGNRVGWHKHAPGPGGVYFLHRPDECWASTYDAWRWKFSDGNTYRCSDGYTCSSSGSCYKSICAWAV
jgi:hypothetical protein